MTIRSLDPSGELGKLFFQIQSKELHGSQPNPSRSTQSSPSSDAVDLSFLAREIQEQTARAGALPEIRADKVERVRQALQNQDPLATSEHLSDALIRETILNSLVG